VTNAADVPTTMSGIAATPKQLRRSSFEAVDEWWDSLYCLPGGIFFGDVFPSEESGERWFHSGQFNCSLFSNYLYFAHCDFRPYLPQLPSTTPRQKLLKLAIEAEKLLAAAKARARTAGYVQKQYVSRTACKGVKGLCPLLLLSYFLTEESVCYDPMHVLKLILLAILDAMKGENASGTKVGEHCKLKGLHPQIWPFAKEKKTKKVDEVDEITCNPGPWYVIPENRKLTDRGFGNLYTPTGESSQYELRSGIFQYSGSLKAVSILRVLINYMDFVLFFVNLPPAYAELLSMLSDDVCHLFSPFGTWDNVRDNGNRIIETLCTLEGMLPESERYFTIHQLSHLPLFRIRQGALKNWWFVSGERFVGKVAQFVMEGGMSYDKTLFSKYLSFENLRRQEFSNAVYMNSKEKPFFALDENKQTLYFSNFRYCLCKQSSKNWLIRNQFYFFGSLLTSLLLQIEYQSTSAAHAMRSSLYQLLLVYVTTVAVSRRNILNKRFACEEFAKWIIDGDLEQPCNLAISLSEKHPLTYYNQEICVEKLFLVKSYFIRLHTEGIPYYHDAFIGGQRFVSRGIQFQQMFIPDSRDNAYVPMNQSCIRNIMSNKRGCDSICRLFIHHELCDALGDLLKRDYSLNITKSTVSTPPYGRSISFDEYAASINAFIEVQIPDDPVFPEPLKMAAVNVWKLHKIKRLDFINCDDKSSYQPAVRFVPIQHILPTRIALAGINAQMEIMPTVKMASVDSKRILTLEMDRTQRKVMESLHLKVGNLYSTNIPE
jgi:hypothetical protein